MNSRKIVSLLLVVIILATMLAACSGSATRAVPTTAPETKPFVVASDASFPPMEFVDETKAIVGFDIDMMNAVAAAMGFKVEYKNTAWDGIFAGLESAAYDAVLSAVAITDERKQKYDFSEPYVNAGQIVVVRTDEMAITGDKTLAGKLVGAAEKGVGRGADAQLLPLRAFLQVQPFLHRKHEGLFRIDVLARIERLPRHLVVNGRNGEVDDDVDRIVPEQFLHGFGAEPELLGAGAGRVHVDVRAGAHLDAPEQRGEREIGGRDVAAADHADAECLCHGRCPQKFFADAIDRRAKRSMSFGLSCSIT